MPQFIMPASGETWDALPDFTQGYLEALFFCNQGSDDDWGIPVVATFSDIHPDSLAKVIAFCAKFTKDNRARLETAGNLTPGSDGFEHAKHGLDDRRLGQLFYYRSAGHGIAFTDDGDAPCLVELDKLALYLWENYVSFDGTYIFIE